MFTMSEERTHRQYPAQAEVEELEDKLKSLESICSPIISKMYQGGARPAFSIPCNGLVCLTGWCPRRVAKQAQG